MDKKIVVRIYSMAQGLLEYDEVSYIHLKSKQFNLMIYEDYFPFIGELEGYMSFMSHEQLHEFDNIVGYFIHRKNQFELIVRE